MTRGVRYYGEIESRKGHIYVVYWSPRNFFVWASLKNHSLMLRNIDNCRTRDSSEILKIAKEMIDRPEFEKR